MRGAQVIALRPGVAQEVGGGDGADDVRAVVVVHGAAVAVAEVARHLARLRAAGLRHTGYSQGLFLIEIYDLKNLHMCAPKSRLTVQREPVTECKRFGVS